MGAAARTGVFRHLNLLRQRVRPRCFCGLPKRGQPVFRNAFYYIDLKFEIKFQVEVGKLGMYEAFSNFGNDNKFTANSAKLRRQKCY